MPKLTGKRGIMEYLRAHVGEVIHNSKLFEASGNQSEYTRRIREIRGELGWPIQTHHDVDDLKPDEYRLAELPSEVLPSSFQRNVSQKLRALALDRNGFTCQMCGAAAGDMGETGRIVRLHVGHVVSKEEGGKDELANLKAYCSDCNQGAKNLVAAPQSRIWLLGKVRNANRDDQRAVYDWLQTKFGTSE